MTDADNTILDGAPSGETPSVSRGDSGINAAITCLIHAAGPEGVERAVDVLYRVIDEHREAWIKNLSGGEPRNIRDIPPAISEAIAAYGTAASEAGYTRGLNRMAHPGTSEPVNWARVTARLDALSAAILSALPREEPQPAGQEARGPVRDHGPLMVRLGAKMNAVPVPDADGAEDYIASPLTLGDTRRLFGVIADLSARVASPEPAPRQCSVRVLGGQCSKPAGHDGAHEIDLTRPAPSGEAPQQTAWDVLNKYKGTMDIPTNGALALLDRLEKSDAPVRGEDDELLWTFRVISVSEIELLRRALSGLPQPTPSEAATEAVYEMFEFHGYHRSGVVPKVGQLALSAAYRAQFGSPPSPPTPKEG